eukprot:355094-Chlamydomonas_euryale.AAC.4
MRPPAEKPHHLAFYSFSPMSCASLCKNSSHLSSCTQYKNHELFTSCSRTCMFAVSGRVCRTSVQPLRGVDALAAAPLSQVLAHAVMRACVHVCMHGRAW